jgi:hypothetical protein
MFVPCTSCSRSPERLHRKDDHEVACIIFNKLVEETVHQVLFQPVDTNGPATTGITRTMNRKIRKSTIRPCETLSLDLFGLFKELPQWTLSQLNEEKKMFKQYLHKAAAQQSPDPESDLETDSDLSRRVDLTKYALLKLFLSEKKLQETPHMDSTSTKGNKRVVHAQLILYEQFFQQVYGRPIQKPQDWLPITKTLKKFQEELNG